MTTVVDWLRDPSPTSRRQARLGQVYLAWLRLKRNHLAMIGLAIVALLVIVAALAPWITPYDPITQALRERLQPPLTPGHILGTDDFGRDILSRLIMGSRITLFIIALVAVTAPVFGLLILIWPFTRLVHVFSAPLGYFVRPYIVYRSRDDRPGASPGTRPLCARS